MAAVEPAWRNKTRPCPYYQKGRCFFGDACNFVHTDMQWSAQEPTLIDSPDNKGSKIRASPKTVTVKSPPRSPRLSGLLAALKDVIGDDEEEEEFSHNYTIGKPAISRPSSLHQPHDGRIHFPRREESQDSILQDSPESSTSSSRLLSPVSDMGLVNLQRDDYPDRSFDSGHISWMTPGPMIMSPPRSPSVQSTFDLFPSSFGSVSTRLVSPRLAAFLRRPPSVASHASARSSNRGSSDGSLDSPSDYYAAKQETQSQATEDTNDTTRPSLRPLESHQEAIPTSPDTSLARSDSPFVDEDDLDYDNSTSRWDAGANPTAVFIGSPPSVREIRSAIEAVESSPVQYLEGPHVVDEIADASSSFDISYVVQEEEDTQIDMVPSVGGASSSDQSLEYFDDSDASRDWTPSSPQVEADAFQPLDAPKETYTPENSPPVQYLDYLESRKAPPEAASPPATEFSPPVQYLEYLASPKLEEEAVEVAELPISPTVQYLEYLGSPETQRTRNASPAAQEPHPFDDGRVESSMSMNQDDTTDWTGSSSVGEVSFWTRAPVGARGSVGVVRVVNPEAEQSFADASPSRSFSSAGPSRSSLPPTPSVEEIRAAIDTIEASPVQFLDTNHLPEDVLRSLPSAEEIRSAESSPIQHLRAVDPVEEDLTTSSSVYDVEQPSMVTDDMTWEAQDISGVSSSSRITEESPTAKLPYLAQSPPVEVAEPQDDTITSFYSAYNETEDDDKDQEEAETLDLSESPRLPADPMDSSDSPSPPAVGRAPSPYGLFRERVFTPPPPKSSRSSKISLQRQDSVSSIASLPSPVDLSSPSRPSFTFQPRPRDSASYLDRALKSSSPTSGTGAQVTRSPKRSSIKPAVKGLRPLRLSTLLTHKDKESLASLASPSAHSSHHRNTPASTSSASVTSDLSLNHNALQLSTPLTSVNAFTQPCSPYGHAFTINNEPQSAPLPDRRASVTVSLRRQQRASVIPSSPTMSEPGLRHSHSRTVSSASPTPSEPTMHSHSRIQEEDEENTFGPTQPPPPQSAPAYPSERFSHAIATPRPDLLFAIASDDAKQVLKVLEAGEGNPNEASGPQSALEFALTNDQLSNKLEIAKTLLAHGANPTSATVLNAKEGGEDSKMDLALRYHVTRADDPLTRRMSALMHRSKFRQLKRVIFDIVGQDRVLEQLFRVLSIHTQQAPVTPLVILLCGPSGMGKTLLAHRFGPHLDCPTHTVNLTTLRSSFDLWQTYSMNPTEDAPKSTLLQFLTENQGKRCVVVLDEIEKTEDHKLLWSLLVPWEFGRCTFDGNSVSIDVRNVIWIATSNIGHDVVPQFCAGRENTANPVTREEYVQLMKEVRPQVADCLGVSVTSRLTTILPFIPFSAHEKRVIATETLHQLAGDLLVGRTPKDLEVVVEDALTNFGEADDGRSLYRAVSNQLVDLV